MDYFLFNSSQKRIPHFLASVFLCFALAGLSTAAWCQGQTGQLAAPTRQFTTATGTLQLKNWQPDRNQTTEPQPSISSIAVKYRLEPSEDKCRITRSMQWYLGNEVYFRGKGYSTPAIRSEEMRYFSLVVLRLSAKVFAGNRYVGSISLDMGKTPIAGGTWGPDVVDDIPWDKLINGVSVQVAKETFYESVKLQDLKIEEIVTAGGPQFRKAAYERFVTQAEGLAQRFAYGDARELFVAAQEMAPEQNYPRERITFLNRLLQQYENSIRSADKFYRQNAFLQALPLYQEAINTIPGQAHPIERVREIIRKAEEFDRLDQRAIALMADRKNVEALFQARQLFREAERILPVDKKQYLQGRFSDIEQALMLEYQLSLNDGYNALQVADFPAAIQAFKRAAYIFPEKDEAKEGIQKTEEAATNQLYDRYSAEISVAISERNNDYDGATKAIDPLVEQCYLDKLTYHQCQVDHFMMLRQNAPMEMRANLYREYYARPIANCQPPSCTPGQDVASPSADIYLQTARRKHQHWLVFQHPDFARYRDEYIDQAIAANPRFVEAYFFKSELTSSYAEELVLLNTILRIDSEFLPAKNRKQTIEGGFTQEVYQKVEENDQEYMLEALKSNLLRDLAPYNGYDLTQYATVRNQPELLAILLDQSRLLPGGTETNANALLEVAVNNRASAVVSYLIQSRRANPNYTPQGKEPLLLTAVRQNDLPVFQELLSAGAKVKVTGEGGNTPLDIAFHQDYYRIADQLLTYYQPTELPNRYLLEAIDNNSHNLVEMLLRKGISPNLADAEGNTALHRAIVRQSTGICQILLRAGANAEASDRRGNSPLMLAIQQKMPLIAEALINRNVALTAPIAREADPFYLSIQHNLPTVTNLLLTKNVAIAPSFEIASQNGEHGWLQKAAYLTATYAIDQDQRSYMAEILRYQPEIGFENYGPENLLRYAIQKDRLDIFMMLIEENRQRSLAPQQYSALHLAVDEQNLAFVSALLNRLINVRAKDITGASALHLAVKKRFSDGVAILADRLDVNATDNLQMTPLHHAVEANDPNIVRILLAKGANKKLKDSRGWTPKKLAAKTKKRNLKKLL